MRIGYLMEIIPPCTDDFSWEKMVFLSHSPMPVQQVTTECELCNEPVCERCGGCACEENACACDLMDEDDE